MTKSGDGSKLDPLVRAALRKSSRPVLAVSGGLDSMVLLDISARLARGSTRSITVATFDHASGAHSERAAAFVCARACAYGLPVVVGRAEHPERTEAGWRAARWRFLRSVAHVTGGVVLTAHTRDDQLETVLMRALRGAGARGLAGLFAPSAVQRPLLAAARVELANYAVARELDWVEDPTNRSPAYLRNRVRRDLLPALRRVRPGLGDELLDLARRAAEWRAELSDLVDAGIEFTASADERGDRTLDVAAADMAGYTRPMLGIVWPELASRVGVVLDARGTRRAAEFTISSHAGSRMQLSGGWELMRSRTAFELRRSEHRARASGWGSRPLQSPMTWDRWCFQSTEREGANNDWMATLAAGEEFRVRVWRPGDRLTISRGGRLIARKVKYFLSDAGISGHIRARWPVVVAGDEVVWIPGVRRSDAATARSGRPVVTYVCDYLDRRS